MFPLVTLVLGGMTLADMSLIAAIISAFGSILGGLLEMFAASALAGLGPWILAAVIAWQLGNIACAYINKK